ncbi:MAG: tRNA (adenosine(37)-N6)-threonylcarbamoyltransferase complex transferase subunit TsaD [Candidatus Eisenbacteria bacterium]|nr:tRNA (adenosine(37)-N6)-threonylcarbamoyltransferase complex transferase subunit TsaD [Candidatus Eisenbacteria bacterium]
MLVLGIETSCDDTAAAVLRDGRAVLSNVVSSQPVHSLYGGVVPEIASRHHITLVVPVVTAALDEAGVTLDEIDGIAATMGPGLIGSLLVGLCFGKALAFATRKPCVGVNHVEAHLFAVLAEGRELRPPFVGLCVSGGHTELVYVKEFGRYELIGSTVDDAAGEAIDKVAKMMGLGFPGGPEIEALAADGDPGGITFPKARLKRAGMDMSFSGLKTAVKYFLETHRPLTEELKRDVAASFQRNITEVLVQKLAQACEAKRVRQAVLAGGVACNRELRQAAAAACEELGVELLIPSPPLCSDNGVMVAVAGTLRLAAGERSPLGLCACSTLEEVLDAGASCAGWSSQPRVP